MWVVREMYPSSLELTLECESPGKIVYLDMEIRWDRGGFFTTLYDKRDAAHALGRMDMVRKFPHVESKLSRHCIYTTLTSFFHRIMHVVMRVHLFVSLAVDRIVWHAEDGYGMRTLVRYTRKFFDSKYAPRARGRHVGERVLAMLRHRAWAARRHPHIALHSHLPI